MKPPRRTFVNSGPGVASSCCSCTCVRINRVIDERSPRRSFTTFSSNYTRTCTRSYSYTIRILILARTCARTHARFASLRPGTRTICTLGLDGRGVAPDAQLPSLAGGRGGDWIRVAIWARLHLVVACSTFSVHFCFKSVENNRICTDFLLLC